MNDKTPKCYWCDNDAEGIDYRLVINISEFDGGVVSKIVTCKRCFNLSTEHLRELKKITMNTTENNKLIAEFMNSTNDGNNAIIYDTKEGAKHKFHTSWDWLMPVVKKIDIMVVDSLPSSEIDKYSEPIFLSLREVNINLTIGRIIQFIKWYNENK